MENSIRFNIPMRSIYAFIASIFMVWVTYITLKEISTRYDNFFDRRIGDQPITQSDIFYLWYPIIAYVCISLSAFSIASVFKKVKISPLFPISFKRKVNGLTDSFFVPILLGLVGSIGCFVLFGSFSLVDYGLSIRALRFPFFCLVLGFNIILVATSVISTLLGLIIEFSNANKE